MAWYETISPSTVFIFFKYPQYIDFRHCVLQPLNMIEFRSFATFFSETLTHLLYCTLCSSPCPTAAWFFRSVKLYWTLPDLLVRLLLTLITDQISSGDRERWMLKTSVAISLMSSGETVLSIKKGAVCYATIICWKLCHNVKICCSITSHRGEGGRIFFFLHFWGAYWLCIKLCYILVYYFLWFFLCCDVFIVQLKSFKSVHLIK